MFPEILLETAINAVTHVTYVRSKCTKNDDCYCLGQNVHWSLDQRRLIFREGITKLLSDFKGEQIIFWITNSKKGLLFSQILNSPNLPIPFSQSEILGQNDTDIILMLTKKKCVIQNITEVESQLLYATKK